MLTPSGKAWTSVQSLVLQRYASTSLSGLPANSGLKWNQFNWGTGARWIDCVGGIIHCAGGAGSCTGGTGSTTGGTTGGSWGAGGPLSAMSNYIVDHITKMILILYLILTEVFKPSSQMNTISSDP